MIKASVTFSPKRDLKLGFLGEGYSWSEAHGPVQSKKIWPELNIASTTSFVLMPTPA
jgi:hypothetical protein